MQLPTAPKTQAHENVDALYRRHHRDLQRSVAGAVRAPNEIIEDACQAAWAIMLRAQPRCESAFGWLRAVAIHEAYHLLTIRHREAATVPLGASDADQRTPAVQPLFIDDAIDALEALRTLASLPQRQREDLTLHMAGYTYQEIRARAPGRTMTNVEKSLRKARARARRSRP